MRTRVARLVLCFFYNDMQVFEIKAVALFGDAIELLDDPTVDGGGFGIGLQMEVFKKVVKVGGAIDKVFVVADPFETLPLLRRVRPRSRRQALR